MKSQANYSLPFACFVCRKSFKIAWSGFSPGAADPRVFGHRCPQCSAELSYCGRFFKAPPQGDVKRWREVQELVRGGQQFK